MICPQTPREADMDEQGSLSSDDTDSVTNHHITSAPNSDNDNGDSARIAPGTSGSSTTTKSSDLKAMRRSKRVASMSISSDQHQHLFMGAHGLPPLPPLATSTSGTFNSTNTTKPQRSSFFCSPSLHDSASNSSSDSYSSRDSTAHRPSQPLSNNSTSSVSSTFTSSTSTATIPLTRPSSPPDQHHGQYQSLMGPFAHGMPFSNMLDLATAKAENITGLYFAKQMNNQSKENSRMEAGGSSLQGSEGQHQQQQQYGKDGQAWKRTRAVTSTGSPAMDYFSSAPASADLEKNSTLPILALDGARISGSSLSTTTPSTPAAAGAAFQGTPKMTPPKGLHRRSHSASHFFHLSSLKHHSPAQFNLALCYEHGQGGVEQDLTKALYFYQQAADQGHTKASYNLGCICYNQGEISKAMAWFESAGKCCVQGLKADAGILSSSSSSSSSSTPGSVRRANGPMLECPMPKATILPHELEDMLMMGDHHSGSEGGAGGGGPFVAYLPAILCLALLCRQGVQTRKGEVILRRDPDQAVALLQRLLDRAPARMLNKLEKGHQQSHPPLRQQPSPSLMSAPGSGSRTDTGAAVRRDPQKRASLQTVPTPQQQQQRATTAASSSIFSTSCPQLPLGLSSSMSPLSSSCSASATLAGSGGGGVRVKRPSTVEDADDDDDDDYESAFPTNGSRNNNTTLDPRRSSGQRQRSFLDSEEEDHEEEEEEDLHGSDVHEAWSVILAQQLLKAWQQLLQPQSQPLSHQGRATPASASMEEGRIHQRIVRHHLLYITNPTLGKNFYNLGVLYDLYLEHAQIARRCYRSAYQNCRPCLLSPVHNDAFLPCVLGPSGAGAGVGVESGQATQQRLAGLVTRINSAWNLGVLHAKHQEWPRARSWFLKAQQDVLAHERIVAAASIANAAVESGAQDQDQDLQRRGGRSGGEGEKGVVSDLTALLMKQGTTDGKEAKWSSNAEELLSLGGGRDFEMKQRRSASKKSNGGSDVQQEEGDESKIRRRSLVNVLPSLGGQSNISARGARVERRGRSDGRDGSVGNEREDFLAPKDSFGSRHAREHGLMMHLSTSSSAGSSSSSSKAMRGGASSVKPGNKSTSSLSSSRGGGGNGGGLDGIRTDASKVAWVLRWVESNMDPPCSSSSLSL
ncbi:hypothetical protein BGZ47_003708 [Haplosporangium gracile]|nr:hypothetical protein BGZ47_003708 [Haplosporangium gracile]